MTELLSPAGSFETLHAAIRGGADAIYFGVEQLNMRARSARTFSITDIKQIAAVCRSNCVKAYITLNTVMFDHDLQLLKMILKEVKKHKIDAVICSDIAVMELCRQMMIPVHVSTQANVSNIEAVKFFSAFADVVVLARELSLKQIEKIIKEIRRKKIRGISRELMKIESFAHGSLCMAVSGKCYLSLHMHNASANRGACLQNCRRPYKVFDAETNEELLIENEYIMSPKDLCTIDILDQLVNTGIDVLKIEGRTKGPDYVFTTTQCYREALNAIAEKKYTEEKITGWKKRLQTVYNRGFWEGYYLGRHFGEWSAPGSVATEKKVYVGKGVKYYPKIKVAEFKLESGTIGKGDELMITSPSFGILKEKIERLVVNGIETTIAVKGDSITLPMAEKITSKDKLYKIIKTENA